jgi:Acyl-CoA dehydrogenase, C-terminal domain
VKTSHQLVQRKIADMYTTMNASRALYAVAKACDRGETMREDAAGAILYASEKATECGHPADMPNRREWPGAAIPNCPGGILTIPQSCFIRQV